MSWNSFRGLLRIELDLPILLIVGIIVLGVAFALINQIGLMQKSQMSGVEDFFRMFFGDLGAGQRDVCAEYYGRQVWKADVENLIYALMIKKCDGAAVTMAERITDGDIKDALIDLQMVDSGMNPLYVNLNQCSIRAPGVVAVYWNSADQWIESGANASFVYANGSALICLLPGPLPG